MHFFSYFVVPLFLMLSMSLPLLCQVKEHKSLYETNRQAQRSSNTAKSRHYSRPCKTTPVAEPVEEQESVEVGEEDSEEEMG
jgi:hypothetical protein